jgi:hypothetical protein
MLWRPASATAFLLASQSRQQATGPFHYLLPAGLTGFEHILKKTGVAYRLPQRARLTAQ